jgi:hypothetical protein
VRRIEEEVNTLHAVEQQLQNAAGSLRLAEQRLAEGPLRENVRMILRSLDTTLDLTRRSKRIVIDVWRAEMEQPAA